MRTIPAAMLASIQAGSAKLVHLIEFSIIQASVESPVLNITDAAADIAHDSKTWVAIGGAIDLQPIGESPDERAQGLDFALPAVDFAATVSILKGTQHRGGILRVWIAHMDMTTGVLVADPLGPWKFFTQGGFEVHEVPPEDDVPGHAVISGRAASRLAEFDRQNGILTNVESHQRQRAGDTFFQNVPDVMGREIFWGGGASTWANFRGR